MTEAREGPGEPAARAAEADPEQILRDMLTDRRALTDGVIPPILFVGVNALWGLGPAAIAGGSYGIGTALYRAVRRDRMQHALGGLFGLGIAILIALRTGRASTYFVPNVISGSLIGSIALVSALVGRPASAAIARFTQRHPREWYRQPRVFRAHMTVTIAWGVFYLGRSGLRAWLIATDRTAQLAGTALVLGFPAAAGLLAGTFAFLRWRLAHVAPPAEPDA